jgi:predicted DNA-binding protein (UPF0251 family)
LVMDGATQTEAARAVGVSQASVSKWAREAPEVLRTMKSRHRGVSEETRARQSAAKLGKPQSDAAKAVRLAATADKRAEAIRLVGEGLSFAEAGRQVGAATSTVSLWLKAAKKTP